MLDLPPRSVAEALAALLKAGVVRTHERDDCAGWWLDPKTSWVTTIEVLVEIYEMNRGELLSLMKNVAFEHVRARRAAGTTVPATCARRTHSKPS